MNEVASWNSEEANFAKEPQTFNDFTYDTETDEGILNKLDEVKKLIGDINADITDIGTKYDTLKGYYEMFTDYFEMMDSNKNGLQSSVDAIQKAYESALTEMQLQLVEQQKVDSELLEDLDQINELLTKSDTESDGSSSGDTNKPIVPGEEAPSEEAPSGETPAEDTSVKDPLEVVDDVIAGKYGTGEDRKKALAEAGYDPSEVQDLVNRKLKGEEIGTVDKPETSLAVEPEVETGTVGDTINNPSGNTETTTPQTTTPEATTQPATTTPDNNSTEAGFRSSGSGIPAMDENGLVVRTQSQAGQDVINKLYAEIPTHANGAHSGELDSMIDNLSAEECAWVLERIEDKGFGQTGAGYAGQETPESHANFIQEQVIDRFGGDIHNVLKSWGTHSYSGY